MKFSQGRRDMEEEKVLGGFSRRLRKDGGAKHIHKTKGMAAIAAVKAKIKGAPSREFHQEQDRELGRVRGRDISLESKLSIKHEDDFDGTMSYMRSFERAPIHIPVKRQSSKSPRDFQTPDDSDWGYPTARNQYSELTDIENYLDRAKTELPELQGPKGESAEDSVIRIVQTYKRISASLRDSKGRLEPIDKLKENYQRAENELKLTKQEVLNWQNRYEEDRHRLEWELKNLHHLVEKVKTEAENQKVTDGHKSRKEQDALQRENETLKERYENSLRNVSEVTTAQTKQISDLVAQMDLLEKEKKALQEELKVREFRYSQQRSEERAQYDKHTEHLNKTFGDRVKETSEMFERRLQHEKIENEARLQEAEAQSTLIKQQVEQIRRNHEDEIQQLRFDMEEKKQKEREQMKQQLEAQRADEGKLLEVEHAKMKQQVLELQECLAKEREDQKTSMLELQAKHNAQKNHQKMETEMCMKRELAKYEEMVRRLKSHHKAEIARQGADAELRSRKQQKRFEIEVREMKESFLKLVELKRDLDQQIPQAQIDIPSMRTRLGDKPGTDIRQLRAVTEEYKMALSSQHYQGLKDHHIVTRFRTIASEIERLARVEWDDRRAVRWPCTENNLLRLNPQNTRKLKQYIVQSSLWVFLYERIFQSPFCMFGHEGAEMDRDWEDIYSPEAFPARWPDISPAIEDKRCANAKRCLVIIDPSIEATPENARLKDSYELVIATAVEAFSKLMETITSFGESGRRVVSNILRLCAKVWLECCSQQYRLMVRVLVPSGNVLHLGPRAVPSLSLLRVPELRRYGSLQGGNFKEEETIVGRKGVVDVFPAP